MDKDKENLELNDQVNESISDSDISETESLQAQIEEMRDKYLRCAAELENTRRRAQIDAQSLARTRSMDVAASFLPLIDAIEAAAIHSPEDDGIKSLLMASAGALAKVGITKIESVGQILNPMFHNAIQTAESEKPVGTIIQELQSGYMFADVVLRPSMVVVSK